MTDLVIITIGLTSAAVLYMTGIDRKLSFQGNSLVQSLERSPQSVLFLSFAVPMIVMSLLSLIYGVPFPGYADEYGYILNADTFLHGRLSNPSPPTELHPFLGTHHQFLSPTYNTKYFPGQGLFLALGALISGQYITGVFLAASLATASCVWLVQFFTKKFAFIFYTFIIASFFYGLSYWGHSYWGGALAAFGGNLLIGASLRALARPQISLAFVAAAGAWLLANTRPFEGIGLSAAVVLAALTVFSDVGKPFSRDFVVKFLVPAAVVLGCGIGWNFYYFNAVTGNPLLTPYQWHHSIADFVPLWMFTDLLPEPAYPYQEMKRLLYEVHLPLHQQSKTPLGYIQILLDKATRGAEFFLLPGMLFLLVPGLVKLRREKYVRFFLLSLVAVVVGALFSLYFNPHYLAPFSGLLVISLAGVLDHISHLDYKGRMPGRLLAVAFCASLVTCGLLRVHNIYSDKLMDWSRARADIVDLLEQSGGKHVVIVMRPDNYTLHREWVYNGADLESSPVIWARFLGEDGNKVLQRHFADRELWLVDIQTQPLTLTPLGAKSIEPN